MKYTFEISVSGCSTTCAHCYVSGGRSFPMDFGNFKTAMINLKFIIKHLDGEKFVTLGNEIFTHQNAPDFLRTAHELLHEYSSFKALGGGIPTTGIALLNRTDKDEILNILKKMDCNGFDFSLLAGEKNHNLLVKNKKAFDSMFNFGRWTNEKGLYLGINFIISKPLISDWDEVFVFSKQFPHAKFSAVIPMYLPVTRLQKFQQYRAEYDDYKKLNGKLSALGINEENLFKAVEYNCEKSVFDWLNKYNFDYLIDESKQPLWAFFNISHDCNVFYGNAGARTLKLGNILTDPPQKLLDKIKSLPSNYGWTAYYKTDKLPPIDKLISKLSPLKTNYVYPSIQDCIYSWLDKCGIQNIII